MHRMAAALLERETLDAEDIRKIINGQELPPLKLGGGGGPTGLAADVQQVLRPEGNRGTGFPEGSPSPA